MKSTLAIIFFCWATSNAFTITSHRRGTASLTQLHETDTIFDPETETNLNKERLLKTAMRLKEQSGTLLFDKKSKDELKEAVAELENLSEPPAVDNYKDKFVGDWTLLCSTTSSVEGVDTSKVSFLENIEPIRQIRDTIRDNTNKYLKVRQIIRTDNDGRINRVDHVLEYNPPTFLKDILKNVPSQLSNFNINPLDVTKSKIVLIHKASIESEMPLMTKLGLQSIVLNVAGQSRTLDPNGSDVLGLNLPLGEFINAGSFETTYMDDELRISRGKLGLVDQLRVFIRSDALIKEKKLEEVIEGNKVGRGVEAEMDVDETTDPEFVAEEVEKGESDVEEPNGSKSNNDEDDPHTPRDSEEANSI